MTVRFLPFLLLAACGPRIAGTADARLPSQARAMVLWQGWDGLGADGGSGAVRDRTFAFGLRPVGEPLASRAAPESLVGLVVAVDGPVDEVELHEPDGLAHVLGADPDRAVVGAPGRGDESGCIDCGSGTCVDIGCDAFEIAVTDAVLELGFTVPWGGEPGLVYDESGTSVAFAERSVGGENAQAIAVYLSALGEPRVPLVTVGEASGVEVGSLHLGEGLVVAEVEWVSGARAVVVWGVDGIERWRINHGENELVDGPYLSNDGRIAAWAERTRVVLADAHTGEELSSVRVSEDVDARVRWSSTSRGVFVFPGSGLPFTVGVTAKDWPWCDGSASRSSNRCAPSGEQWGIGVLGQVARAPEQVCDQTPYGDIDRASSPPEELIDCE